MMSKVLLAVLVISFVYVSDAVFFRDRFPGKKFGDMAECEEEMEIKGATTRIPSKNSYGTKHAVACAKYCLKQKLRGERKGDDKLKAIVGSEWDRAKICTCFSGGAAKFEWYPGPITACIFKTEEKPKATCEPAITSLINGEVSCTDGNNEGSTCTLTCDDGYTCGGAILHVHESTCTNGQWDSKPVEECIPISCPAESLELTDGVESVNCENGKSGKDTDWLSKCTFTCKDGYSFEDETEQMIRCVGDGDHSDGFGRWLGDVPKCKKEPAPTPLCTDSTWLQAGYAQGEPLPGDDGYLPWTGGNQDSKEDCYQKCIELQDKYPDINAVGYGIEGRMKKNCGCYPAATGFTGEWKAKADLGAWGTNKFFCMMPEVEAPATCEPAITTLKKGTVKCSDGNNEGSTCELTCDIGYTCGEYEPHVHEVTCTNGAWSETPVEECIPKECPISYLENLEKSEGMESVTCSGGIEGMRNTMNARCEFKCKDGYLPSRTDLSDSCRIRLDGEVKEGWWYYGNDPVTCIKQPEGDCDWKEATGWVGSNYMMWAAFDIVGKDACEEACLAKRGEGKTIGGARLGAEGRFINQCHCYETAEGVKGEGSWKETLTGSQTNYLFCVLPPPDFCKDEPCVNGGTCVNGDDKYTCTCTDDFTGNNCEKEAAAEPVTCTYSVSPQKVTFDGGKAYCTNNGGVLAGQTIRTLAERREMAKKVTLKTDRAGYWVDFTPADGKNTKGKWQWQKGSDTAGPALPPGQMDTWPYFAQFAANGGAKPCGFLYSVKPPHGNSNQLKWNHLIFHDRDCSSAKNYVLCEHCN